MKYYIEDEEKREIHNIHERRRRINMKANIIRLRNKVPTIQDEGASRMEILTKACEFIQDTQKDIERIKYENEEVLEQNKLLRYQIRLLQKQKERLTEYVRQKKGGVVSQKINTGYEIEKVIKKEIKIEYDSYSD